MGIKILDFAIIISTIITIKPTITIEKLGTRISSLIT